MELRIALPEAVKRIIDRLEEAGYEAFAVGGCVRDSLLGRVPEDWDITTSATPEQVKELFHKTVDTGIEHGTVTVLWNHVGYEVTTYRLDGEYMDGRHPKEVTFTGSLAEDLKRRDFTINAMAYNESAGLVDLFHGREDLEQGIIRCVGDAEERFSEDALRIFRAVRFAAQLGFTVEEKTREAMAAKVDNLRRVSAERIRVELVKLLLGACPDRLLLAYETGITRVVLPEWDRMMVQSQDNPHHCYTVGMHTLKSIEALHGFEEYATLDKKDRTVLNMAMLLHDVAKPLCASKGDDGVEHFYGHQAKSAEMAREVLRRLKFDNDTMKAVQHLILHHDTRYQLGKEEKAPEKVRRITGKLGHANMRLLFLVQMGDVAAQAPAFYEDGMGRLALMRECYETIVREKQCVSLAELEIRGGDLMELGYSSGQVLGEVLKELLEAVLRDPEKNNRRWLVSEALRLKKRYESK